MKEHEKIEFIESYIRVGNDYQWNDNHGELVRCKDCKHNTLSLNSGNSLCELDIENHCDKYWYCADGERRER